MKRIIKIIGLFVVVALAAVVMLRLVLPLAFYKLSQPQLLPAGSGLPDRDIVFTIDNGKIGFINADGSGLVTRTVSRELFDWPSGIYSLPSLRGPTTWSLDKRSIVGRYPTYTTPNGGSPIFIQKNGEIHSCADKIEKLYGEGRVLFVSETEVLTVVDFMDRAYRVENKVVVVDIANGSPTVFTKTAFILRVRMESTREKWLTSGQATIYFLRIAGRLMGNGSHILVWSQ